MTSTPDPSKPDPSKPDPSKPDPSKPEAGRGEPEKAGWLARKRARPGAGEAVKAEPAPPPPRKKRKTGITAMFSGLMTATVFLLVAVFAGVTIAHREFAEPGPLQTDKVVIIERGSTTEDIVETLTREGVVTRSSLLWAVLLWRDITSKFSAEGASRRAKSGEYLFRQSASMSEVVDVITSGRSIQHAITIPEGLTSEQIVERLMQNELLTGEVATIPPEGALLPDTYRINRGTSREALVARMASEQRRVLNEIWNRRAKDLPLRNPRELVTLASIVEKETGRADERPRVASVFYNRIEKKMRLQSDPTIIYGLVGGKGSLGRPISRADIDRPTAYNTYTIPALPPGPIANPGRAAMEATANPSRTRDLYFVADGTGGHAFAETLEQHNRNVARWRQIEAMRAATPAAPGLQPVPGAPAASSADGSAAPQVQGFVQPDQRSGATTPAPVLRPGGTPDPAAPRSAPQPD
ncbi:MAG: endolytic transglycosylase MltG [Methylobacterium sp.]|nr:endolytic transglycosylase MltG [Methylobacterium sp.]MCA3600101.1 endolytic transglycosylase MltG [Methylobacterium sp.]MCA3607499.1 endolytic transglycosylase MltG [Methylobacterium sp.]MCA3608956.1 endolytic transglycosylase MltG [Methylobacterium sp.]MCA3611742.1 endolytic transglycosylase MltG [Methylobacterium sp.]